MANTDCNHKPRVRIGKSEAMCVRCLERRLASNGRVPKAPRRWQEMEQDELAVWYARNVMKVDL